MPLFKVKVDKKHHTEDKYICPARELSNFGLFIIFVFMPAVPITGIWISIIDDVSDPIDFFIFMMSVIILLSWFIAVCTQFYYRKPNKNKPTKF